jgi:glycosyltransferase involved in cell wall biosynthesis
MPGHRILFDASMIQGGGGFTFAAQMVPALASGFPHDRFRVFVRNPLLAEALPALPNLEVEKLPEPSLLERLRFTYLEAPRIARDWKAELYFAAGDYAPLRAPCPVIASAQNANVTLSWHDLRSLWGLRQVARLSTLRLLARLSAASCDAIHYVSADAAGRMGDALGVPPFKRTFTHHGIHEAQWQVSTPRPHPRPYVLSVSSVYRYKNYVRLIEAWTKLARRRPATPDLVIVGDNQDADAWAAMESARAAAGRLASRIRFVGEVRHADVPRWYAHAELFVFPSYLESFGMPLLEAMAARVALVASDLPVFREIAADAAFFCDPFDVSALAGAMEEALFVPGAREALVKRGRERVRSFTWQRSAEALMQIFKRVIEARAARTSGRARALQQQRPGTFRPSALDSGARAAV